MSKSDGTVASAYGVRTSFIASDPDKFISAFGFPIADLQFEPSQTVCLGKLVEQGGRLVVLNEDGDMAGFEATAILAWNSVPSFALDQAAAAITDQLIKRVSNANY